MPADPEAAIQAVVAAVQSGRLTRGRIEESVAKLLAAKERVGLDRNRLVKLDAINDVIDAPESNAGAQQAADRAVTLLRNRSSLVPLAAPERACYVVMPESRTSLAGLTFTQEVKRRSPAAAVVTLDPALARQQVDDLLAPLNGGCETYVVAAFTTASATRGTAALGGELPHAFDTIWGRGKPVVLVALGNPYLLRSLPGVPAYLATFSTVRPSETAAVRALWGEIAIGGRMPVSIPGIAVYGEGIRTAATRAPREPGQ
jgi:beta-N-acetylhexosaminidase